MASLCSYCFIRYAGLQSRTAGISGPWASICTVLFPNNISSSSRQYKSEYARTLASSTSLGHPMYRSVKKHPCMITEYHPIYISCNQREIPRLYSQWLNSVISWLINHCTDWARTGVKSFGRQFDLHDVIYHIWHCNVDKRRCNVVFTTT